MSLMSCLSSTVSKTTTSPSSNSDSCPSKDVAYRSARDSSSAGCALCRPLRAQPIVESTYADGSCAPGSMLR
ncbi:hypothetical protein CI109_100910 [Kwoniella shandongensis]|uniref:Uncharacterized protein n=1 Tax=Kwoniella shandongensis TaxID=1734106 RepID=A0AAJ8LG21_9TREE